MVVSARSFQGSLSIYFVHLNFNSLFTREEPRSSSKRGDYQYLDAGTLLTPYGILGTGRLGQTLTEDAKDTMVHALRAYPTRKLKRNTYM